MVGIGNGIGNGRTWTAMVGIGNGSTWSAMVSIGTGNGRNFYSCNNHPYMWLFILEIVRAEVMEKKEERP